MLNIYIDNSDIDIVGGQIEGGPKLFVKIFRIPCSKVKKSYMHFHIPESQTLYAVNIS